jgi:type II secretory pathway predicted ATPase ExeA
MFDAPEHERELPGILSVFAQNRRAIPLTGNSGCGKTMIRQVIIQHLDGLDLLLHPKRLTATPLAIVRRSATTSAALNPDLWMVIREVS